MNQPRALIPLCLTEMWERFGLYLVQGLLIFYMTKALNFSDIKSYAVMGQFTALVYISPLLGGACADRLLGYRYTILLGIIFLFFGYAILGIPDDALSWLSGNLESAKENKLLIGLSIVILGNGFLKPNISSFLGEFYETNDPRRDSGFTIFYMGFNIGIALSTLSSGYIQRQFGWSACFSVAAAGLILALILFCWGYKYFGDKGLPPSINLDQSSLIEKWLHKKIILAVTILCTAYICYQLLKLAHFGNFLLAGVGILILLILSIYAMHLEKFWRDRMLTLLILIIISIVFWGLFFQIFLVANLFIDRNVDRVILGYSIPSVAFISLEAIFIFLLSPLFAIFWRRLYQKKMQVSRGLQFSVALITIGIALQLLVIGIHFPNSTGLVYPFWIVISYFIITISELLLSPIGLSMVTQLAPPKITGLMMGVWFLGLSYGGLLAGFLGKQASIPKNLIDYIDKTNLIYAHAFQNYALLAFVVAAIVLLITPWLNRLMQLKNSVLDVLP